MNLLLVNDDGISSPSLQLLSRAAKARGHHVLLCAPSTQQSAKSHCFTITAPLLARRWDLDCADDAWAIDGTPADCARLGLMALNDAKIDLVISGINNGYNVGLATYVSGTVGAAREAAFQGVPAMAVSAGVNVPQATLSLFAEWVVTLAEKLVSYPTPPLSVCNVNAPAVQVQDIKAPVLCPISTSVYKDTYVRRESPRGDTYFWLTPEQPSDSPTPGSDQDLVEKGHITVTLLTPDGCCQADYADLLEDL